MKRQLKPGNMLYPVPAVLVSCRDREGNDDLVTVAWTGTVCSDPPMLSISVRKDRYSHRMILEKGEFVVNLTTEKMLRGVDTCGVRSGRDTDKWKLCHFTREQAAAVDVPLVKESPVNIECRVTQVLELGSHDMFLAQVVAVDAAEELFDEKDRLDLAAAGLTVYSHGEYYGLGRLLGSFGYSVRKRPAAGTGGKTGKRLVAGTGGKTGKKSAAGTGGKTRKKPPAGDRRAVSGKGKKETGGAHVLRG